MMPPANVKRPSFGPALLLALALLVLSACEQPYRIGEYVLVEWEAGAPPYPAYIVEQKGRARYRVHYDGYADRWDQDVTIDKIKGRVEGHILRPPPPKRVQAAQGIQPRKDKSGSGAKGAASAAPAAQYQAGDKIKVRWRGTVYPATVLNVVGPDQYLIHYDGHESAWDETVGVARIVSN